MTVASWIIIRTARPSESLSVVLRDNQQGPKRKYNLRRALTDFTLSCMFLIGMCTIYDDERGLIQTSRC